MSGDEIRSIAQSVGVAVKASDSLQEIAYMIIDAQAVAGSQGQAQNTKKMRAAKGSSSVVKKRSSKEADKDSSTATQEEPAKKRTVRRRKTAEETIPSAPAAEAPQPLEEPQSLMEQTEGEPVAKPRRRMRKTATSVTSVVEEKQEESADTSSVVAEETAVRESAAKNAEPERDFVIIQDLPPLESEDNALDLSSGKVSGEEAAAAEPVSQKKEFSQLQARAGAKASEQLRGNAQSYDFGDSIVSCGVLDTTSEGQAFLRSADYNYLSSPDDIYVSSQQIKNYGLKMGDVVECSVRMPRENEKCFSLSKVMRINGLTPDQVRDRLSFEHLTPLFPNEKFRLCKGDGSDSLSARIVDLFAPIGKGQRALLVAQPKTGKTMLMKTIANAIAANHPEAYLMMLLIDERPEEVTDMARTVNAEVIASTFDEPASNHVRIAAIVLEKAKRMVECGHDVVIFLDSITRLARAYNTVAPASGKILTGGVDANALQKPKRFFGAARNIEGGGSLTIIATALIDTGSKMDEVIFEEFKGTGNMELQLDRNLSNKRIFPAVNCVASSTRRDDLLHDKMTLDRMWVLRNHIAEMTSMESMNVIRNLMEKTKNNEEFLLGMNS